MSWFLERLETWGDKPAIVWGNRVYSYSYLLQEVQNWREQLPQYGVSSGMVVAIQGDYSPKACALLLTLIELNDIIVPLTEAAAPHRSEFLDIAEVQVVISLDKNDQPNYEQRAIKPTNPLVQQLITQNVPGLVLFSSGSTGKSKASLHDFSKLLNKFQAQRNSLVTLTFLLLDHIGGINTLLYTFSNGGLVVALQSRDPEEVSRVIQDHHVQLLPTSPTFLNLLLMSEAYKHYDLSSLELVTYGTEVMPESTLKRIHEALPKVRLQQTYGLSELGILRSKSQASDSLWVKVGGEDFETKVVDGTLWIRTKSAMLGYLNAPSPFDDEGWMNTQDSVEVNGEYIRILGRRSEIINVGGQKVYPAEVESILMLMDNVRDVTVYGEANPVLGQIVAARLHLFEDQTLDSLKKDVRAFSKDKLASYKVPAKIEISAEPMFSPRYKKQRRM